VARLPHKAETDTTRARARARRNLILVLWWGSALILLFVISIGGPWLLIVPLVIIGALVSTNTVAVVRGDGAENFALEPGQLAKAKTDHEAISVPATRAPDRRERGRRRGRLEFEGGRVSFTFDSVASVRRKNIVDELSGTTILDLWPTDLVLGPRPSWHRPQLVFSADGVVHVIEFTMPNDLAAGMVGSVVAAEWHRQLIELGASVSPS